jgi:lysophospholipase L1-like esterase
MTTYQNIYFHNCAELFDDPLRQGLRLQRIPEAVRKEIHPLTQRSILGANGVELRFRMPEGWINNEIILSSLHTTYAYVYHGDFKQTPSIRFEVGPSPSTVMVTPPERLRDLPTGRTQRHQFSSELIRIVLGGEAGPVYFHGTTMPVEPPRPGDMPEEMLLAYGTSITAGHHANLPSLESFAAQTARALKSDHLNYGCSGSAFIDPAMVDFLSTRNFNRATLCVSVNMVGNGFSVEEFRKRAEYLVTSLHAAQPEADIACISILPYFRDWGDPEQRKRVTDYRDALQSIVEKIAHPKVAYLHGPDLLEDLSGLSADMVHPNEHGFREIAGKLVRHFSAL